MLKNTGLFVYKTTDMYGDILTKNKEIAKRLGGGLNAISGAAGAVGGGAVVGAGVAACPVSFGLTCVGGVTLGGFIMVNEYGRSKDGVQNLLGAFVSDEGQRVLDSFNPSTYPGERDPLKEAGIDVAKNVGTALFGKYLLKTFAKLDGLDTKVESKTGTNKTPNTGSAENGIYTINKPVADVFPELKGVNPHYVDGAGPGVNTNCVSCVNAAVDRLTSRIPNSVAKPSKGYGVPNDLNPSAPFGWSPTTNPADITNRLLTEGNGSYAVLRVQQPSGVEHAMLAFNRNGTVYYIDPQRSVIVNINPNARIIPGYK